MGLAIRLGGLKYFSISHGRSPPSSGLGPATTRRTHIMCGVKYRITIFVSQ